MGMILFVETQARREYLKATDSMRARGVWGNGFTFVTCISFTRS
jgi:hypothetical protein